MTTISQGYVETKKTELQLYCTVSVLVMCTYYCVIMPLQSQNSDLVWLAPTVDNPFHLDASTGVITVQSPLDHEANPEYSVSFSVCLCVCVCVCVCVWCLNVTGSAF